MGKVVVLFKQQHWIGVSWHVTQLSRSAPALLAAASIDGVKVSLYTRTFLDLDDPGLFSVLSTSRELRWLHELERS